MTAFFAAAFFVLGAIVASFVGVVVARRATGEGWLSGRSRCDACGRELAAADLVPILSYFASGGRARCCGARVSWWSTLAEFALGALFAYASVRVGLALPLVPFLVALSALAALVLYDLRHAILPPPFLAVFVAAAALFAALVAPSVSAFAMSVGVAAALFAFFALIHYASGGRAMGFSDAPLAAGLALLAGPTAFSGFVFSFWIGAAVGIIVLARAPAGSRMGIEVPFAPFLAAGFFLAFFTQWNALELVASLMTRIPGV